MRIKKLSSLQDYLEACFKTEGLYPVLPEDRRESLLTIPLASIWFFLLWVIQASLILRNTHYRGWVVAGFLVPILLACSFLGLAILIFIRHFREYLQGKPPDLSVYTKKIGMFFLVIFPAILVVGTGLYLQSVLVPLYQLVLSVIAMVGAIVLNAQKWKVRLLLEFFRSAWKVLVRSVALIFVLLPILLVIVMLSVFSSDLWAALGNLSLLRILAATSLMIMPAILLLFATLRPTSKKILGTFPSREEIVKQAEQYPLLENTLRRGLVSHEEWSDAKKELAWRDLDKLSEDFTPTIERKVRHWLALLLVLTSLLVTLTFLVYFFVLFHILLQPTLIAQWVGTSVIVTTHSLSLGGLSLSINSYSTDLPVIKVSWVLSVFIALASTVYALTDDSASEKLTGWLAQKAKAWLSLACVYDGVLCPGYQIWRFVRRDKKRGLANVFVVVPSKSTDDEVKRACTLLETRLSYFRNLVYITAFEQDPKHTTYETWISGKRWQLVNNKTNNNRSFDTLDIVDQDINSQSFLGIECLKSGKPIPVEWFGMEGKAISLGKEIWEADTDGLVLHPYVVTTEDAVFVTVRLRKRLPKSAQYEEYVKELVVLARKKLPNVSGITINLTFRESEDTLASFWWHKSIPTITYKDELKNQSRTEKAAAWVT